VITYEAISNKGEKIKGKFNGSKEELLNYLKTENAILIAIKEESPKFKIEKLTPHTIYEDIEQIFYLMSSGLKIDKAIQSIIKISRNEKSAQFWKAVLKKLKEGIPFSIALKEVCIDTKIYIPEFYTNILSVGETVGKIEASLKAIVEDYKFKHSLKKEIKSSLSYPIFLVIMGILTLFSVAGFILPKFAEIFSQEELENLPFLSKLVIKLGLFIKNNVEIFLVVFVLLFSVLIIALKSNKVKFYVYQLLYKLPILKDLLIKLELSNIFSSLHTMLKGGIHLNKAIKLTRNITNIQALKSILDDLQEEVKKGKKLSFVLQKYPIIPYDAISLVSVGEESANLEEILDKLSKKYLLDFKEKVSKILSILEPVVIILVGFFVGLIVIAILLAVLSISDVL